MISQCDPLVGMYSERDVLTIAVPTKEHRRSPVRYRVHVLSGVDVRREPPRKLGETIRRILGRRPLRCAAAMDPSAIFPGVPSLDGGSYSDALLSSRKLVMRPMPMPSCGVIAAKASVVRRWKTVAHYAKLDLDILTAGPIAVLNGVANLSCVRSGSFGALIIRYDDTYLFCLCRGRVIVAINAAREEGILGLTALLCAWQHQFKCRISWGAVMGVPEHTRIRVSATLESVLSQAILPIEALLTQAVTEGGAEISLLDEVSITSSIGLASLERGV